MIGNSFRSMSWLEMGLLTIVYRERQTWRCSHCLVHGSAVWAVRDGPIGPRVTFSPLLNQEMS